MTDRRAFIASSVAAAALSFVQPGKAAGANPLAKWRPGVNYRLLENPGAPTAAGDKVEVLEVFWYGCSHCYALDPVLEEWDTKKAAYIEFARFPVIWGPVHRQHAKLYFTLQVLKRPDLHAKVFETIHKDGSPLSDRDEVASRAMHLAFFKANGVTDKQFDTAYDSMTLAVLMQRATEYTRVFQVDNVPQLYVNAKYATSVSEAGSHPELLSLLDALAESEKR